MPGGEYLPFSELFRQFGIDRIVAMPTPFSAGTVRHPITLVDGLRAAIFVCYEIIFPDEVAAGVKDADFIVNVTNDAWFGDTPGPYQHFRSAQISAAATGLPLVRAANNGISGAIDLRGRVIDAFALNVRGDARRHRSTFPRRHRRCSAIRGINGYLVLALLAADRQSQLSFIQTVDEDLTPQQAKCRDMIICSSRFAGQNRLTIGPAFH